VLGGITRVSGSGMGCEDDWPLCQGKPYPPLNTLAIIEYLHRTVAAYIGFLVLAVAIAALALALSNVFLQQLPAFLILLLSICSLNLGERRDQLINGWTPRRFGDAHQQCVFPLRVILVERHSGDDLTVAQRPAFALPYGEIWDLSCNRLLARRGRGCLAFGELEAFPFDSEFHVVTARASSAPDAAPSWSGVGADCTSPNLRRMASRGSRSVAGVSDGAA